MVLSHRSPSNTVNLNFLMLCTGRETRLICYIGTVVPTAVCKSLLIRQLHTFENLKHVRSGQKIPYLPVTSKPGAVCVLYKDGFIECFRHMAVPTPARH